MLKLKVKHKLIKLSDLIGSKDVIAARFVDEKSKAVKDDYGYNIIDAVTLPKEDVVIYEVKFYYGDKRVVQVSLYVKDGKGFKLVNNFYPANLVVANLLGTIGKSLLKQLEPVIQERKTAEIWTNLYHNFQVGSDPEIFVENGKGEVLAAFDFLPAKRR